MCDMSCFPTPRERFQEYHRRRTSDIEQLMRFDMKEDAFSRELAESIPSTFNRR